MYSEQKTESLMKVGGQFNRFCSGFPRIRYQCGGIIAKLALVVFTSCMASRLYIWNIWLNELWIWKVSALTAFSMHVDQVTDLHRVKSRLLEQCDRFWFATNRYQWGGIKCLHFLFTACGRRRMSPSARHKLALCERNPGFPGRKLIFPQRRSCRGNGIISFQGKKGWGGDELTGVNWVPVDPATLQATKIACAHPPSLSFSGFGEQFS